MSQSGKRPAPAKYKTFKIIRLCILAATTAAAMLFMRFCGAKPAADSPLDALRDSLETIASAQPGEIGIALITRSGDTLTVNNEDRYPLMSVFKLHQALALCRDMERSGASPDTLLAIPRTRLNPDTWSPMLKEREGDTIKVTVRDLMRYALVQSDNNASNLLFEDFLGVGETDRYIATLIPRDGFRLTVSEAQMWDDHSLCYENHTSPLAAARLIYRLFTENDFGGRDGGFIRGALAECKTGNDRIAGPLEGVAGASVAHKTGSGFRTAEGVLTAHNDVAFVTLPDGDNYALAVFVKDFRGDEKAAAKVISEISRVVYESLEGSELLSAGNQKM